MRKEWPYFAEDEVAAVEGVLKSGKVNYWTGSECKLFEQEFAEYVGVPYAVSLANGTLALELALRILGVGIGDEVIVPSRTFIATAASVVINGAKPVVTDVDRVSQNMTVETIDQARTAKTKAIIVVHLAGWPCDLDPILEYAKKHSLRVIEDCAQAHGASYKGKKVGSFGDAAAFSFCQDKIMTAGGEGGMLLLHDQELLKRAWSYKDHGKNFDLVFAEEKTEGFRWLHDSFGTNWRMTEMQAAIARVQLRKLNAWVELRRCNAKVFNDVFDNNSALRTTIPSRDYFHSYYKYYVFVKPDMFNIDFPRDKIISELNRFGINVFSGSCPEIYLEKAFDGYPKDRFPVAKELGETSLMFLIHPTLTTEDVRKTAEIVSDVITGLLTK